MTVLWQFIDTLDKAPIKTKYQRINHAKCITKNLKKAITLSKNLMLIVFALKQRNSCVSMLRMHWRFSTILKTSKKVYEVMFFDMLKYVYSENVLIHYALRNTNVKNKFTSGKINGTKYAVFFLSRAPTHYSFTFNLQFLNELKHNVRLSKT